jgi:hypothetical protein
VNISFCGCLIGFRKSLYFHLYIPYSFCNIIQNPFFYVNLVVDRLEATISLDSTLFCSCFYHTTLRAASRFRSSEADPSRRRINLQPGVRHEEHYCCRRPTNPKTQTRLLVPGQRTALPILGLARHGKKAMDGHGPQHVHSTELRHESMARPRHL